MKIYSSNLTQHRNTMTATEVVQELYRRFPEIDLYDERDKGDNVILIFDGSVKNNMPLKNYLEDTGIDYLIRGNTLYIKAPEDDDLVIAECDDVFSSREFFDKGDGAEYWYFTTHGIQPGSVPRGLDILEIKDRPEGSYFLTNKVLTTDALNYYDIKERSPFQRL